MRTFGLEGARRSRRGLTTRPNPAALRPADLVHRQFRADASCRLWVSGITHVTAWSGFAYVACVTDVFSRRIVRWPVSASLRAEASPLPPLEAADESPEPTTVNLGNP